MLAVHLEFERRLSAARQHLAFSRVVDQEASRLAAVAQAAGCQMPTAAERRLASYRGAIVESYGALEALFVGLASSFAGVLHLLTPYDRLPARVRENNLDLTLRVLGQRRRRRWLNKVDAASMIENLGKCLQRPESYRLNELVFEEHTTNFRDGAARSFLARLQIQFPGPGFDEEMEELVSGSPLGGIVRGVAAAIDLLADRRNEIAHGSDDSGILSREILSALVDVVEAYGSLAHQTVLDTLAYLARDDLVPFGTTAKIFKAPTGGDGEIIGIRAVGVAQILRAQDWIVARSTSRTDPRGFRLVPTRSIEVARVQTPRWELARGENAEGGIWVERRVPVGWEVCAPPAPLRAALGLSA